LQGIFIIVIGGVVMIRLPANLNFKVESFKGRKQLQKILFSQNNISNRIYNDAHETLDELDS
jgi:hypothetical protein